MRVYVRVENHLIQIYKLFHSPYGIISGCFDHILRCRRRNFLKLDTLSNKKNNNVSVRLGRIQIRGAWILHEKEKTLICGGGGGGGQRGRGGWHVAVFTKFVNVYGLYLMYPLIERVTSSHHQGFHFFPGFIILKWLPISFWSQFAPVSFKQQWAFSIPK